MNVLSILYNVIVKEISDVKVVYAICLRVYTPKHFGSTHDSLGVFNIS